MTSLIISPLRLRKIQLALLGVTGSMMFVVAISVKFNVNLILFNFDVRNYETYEYLKSFPIPILAKWLSFLYDWFLSDWVLNALIWGGVVGFIVSVLLIDKLVIDKSTSLIRGNRIENAKKMKKMIKEKSRLFIGKEKVPLPYTNENRSIGIIGMAGSGKTQGIFSVFEQVVRFKETMIIYDRKPDFWIAYYRENTDFLFYPADARSIKWNFFLDIPDDEQEMLDEADKIVKSFIPDTQSKEKFWDNTARMILKGIIIKVKTSPNPSTKQLIDFIREFQTKEEIWANLQDVNDKYGLSIKSLLTEAAEATAGSIMMNLQPYFIKIMRPEFYFEESNFSITKFIESTANKNIDQRLFLVQTKKEEGNYEGYFRVMLDMMTRTILSLENNPNRRIWIFLDEAQTLGKLSEVNDQLAEGRSKGGCVVLATQDLARLEELYGEHLMRNIFQLLSTKLMLQYDDPKGQKFISEFLGEQEVEEKNKNRMISRDAQRDIEQVSERNTTKKVLLTGELGLLKPLSAYLKMPGFPVTIVHFTFFQPSQINFFKKAVVNQMFNGLTLNTNEEKTSPIKKIQAKKTTQEKKAKEKAKVDKDMIETIFKDKNGDEVTEEQFKILMLAGAESTTKGYII
ncbi:MAG: type IV secretion system DNA-binding domain-containing protein [Sulfurimonas sp.]|nr:type IV secretion system DNA-binding domain-containing protein [Sulfurimonas sp.]